MPIKPLLTAMAILCFAARLQADTRDVCYAEGPFRFQGGKPKISRNSVESAAKKASDSLGFGFVTKSGWDCTEINGEAKQCLQESICEESLYIDIKEEAASYIVSVVSLNRGKILRITAKQEKELLTGIETDLKTLLSRSRSYESDHAEKKIEALRKNTTVTLMPLEDEADEQKKRVAEAEGKRLQSTYNRLRTFTISMGVITAVTAAVSIGTAAGATGLYNDLEGTAPSDREKSDLDRFRHLTIASRTMLGITLVTGLTTAILLPFAIKAKKARKTSFLQASAAALNNGGMLVLKGEF